MGDGRLAVQPGRERVKVRRGESVLDAWERERGRLPGLVVHELAAWTAGAKSVAGVDEAGRGPLAGPVVAAAVILREEAVRNPDRYLVGLDDSKKLSPEAREALFPKIHEAALAVGAAFVSAERIDALNIRKASFEAMRLALRAMKTVPDKVLVDGFTIPDLSLQQQAIIGGDALSLSIAAASVVAKVLRDRHMVELDDRYPGYGLAKHKGYATKEHYRALRLLGPCPEHRVSFLSGPPVSEEDADGGEVPAGESPPGETPPDD